MDPVPVRVVGRYAIHGEIASGGMATVHFGRLVGAEGFSRTVAIKRLHPQFAKDPEFVAMFLDEARLVARIRHPNVIPTLDVVAIEGELFLVLEYVQGESLARLFRMAKQQRKTLPPAIVSAIMTGVLLGLHAAHEAKGEDGAHLGIVHRDVSPQNILVGTDGVPRVLDFGVAKAVGRLQTTREGQLKGKLCYMAPEQLRGEASAASDVYAASVVLWEALAGRPLLTGDEAVVLAAVMMGRDVDPPSRHRPGLSAEVDALTLRGLARDPSARFSSAREMARALEKAIPPASASDIGDWVEQIAGSSLSARSIRVAEMESSSKLVGGPGPVHAPAAPADTRDLPSTSTQPGWQVSPKSNRSGQGIAVIIGAVVGALVLAIAFAAQREKPAKGEAEPATAAAAPTPLAPVAPSSSSPPSEASAAPSSAKASSSQPSSASTPVTAPRAPTAKPRAHAPQVPPRGADFGSVIDSRK